MATYLTASAAVGGNPNQLDQMADLLAKAATEAKALAGDLSTAVASTEAHWDGDAAGSYRKRGTAQASALAELPAQLDFTAAGYRTLATALREAQNRADSAMRQSVQIGLAEGDLLGRPERVAAFVNANPDRYNAVAALINEVVVARALGDRARDQFVFDLRQSRRDRTHPYEDRARGSDQRQGRRQRNDRAARRTPGDTDRSKSGVTGAPEVDEVLDHFSNDWAGRAILERYLSGAGGSWTIKDDPEWTQYMMANKDLRQELQPQVEQRAQDALSNYLMSGQKKQGFSHTFHGDIQNGEGVTGYNYLHGTDSTVGDFNISGTTNVRDLGNGTYEVAVDGGYTWNDKINTNLKYSTDRWKDRIAYVLSMGQKAPYDIHITWHAQTKLILDRNGHVVSGTGYPAQ